MHWHRSAFGILTVCMALCARIAAAEPNAKIYPETANGDQVLKGAVDDAIRASKRILINWGVNSSPACTALDAAMMGNEKIVGVLDSSYVYVRMNSDLNRPAAKSLDLEVTATPTLTFLDPFDGIVFTKSYSEKTPDVPSLLSLLYQWKLKPSAAMKALDRARQTAMRNNQSVFVLFSTSWCGWCKRLKAALASPEVSAILDPAIAYLEIDQEKTQGGRELRYRLSGSSDGSIPWYAVVGASGQVIATSNLNGKNMGYPSSTPRIQHFAGMLRAGAPRITEADLASLSTALRANAASASSSNAADASDSRLIVR